MPSDYPRSHRVADYIQRELSGLIRSELKDPRLSPMMTISSVEVSRDLSMAKIYFSVFDVTERDPTHEALRSSSGFLRRRLARLMRTRTVPELRFHYDDSAEKGAHMSALIADAVSTNTTEGEPTEDDNADGAEIPGGSANGATDSVQIDSKNNGDADTVVRQPFDAS